MEVQFQELQQQLLQQSSASGGLGAFGGEEKQLELPISTKVRVTYEVRRDSDGVLDHEFPASLQANPFHELSGDVGQNSTVVAGGECSAGVQGR